MTKFRKILAEISASTAAAQNDGLFTSDFKPSRSDSLVRISIAATNVIVALQADGGSTMIPLNGGAALAADALYTFEVHLDSTREWNIASANVAGVTALLCTVVEVNE